MVLCLRVLYVSNISLKHMSQILCQISVVKRKLLQKDVSNYTADQERDLCSA